MTDYSGLDRRSFVKGAGGLVVAGTLAGCTSNGNGGDDGGSGGGSDGGESGDDGGSGGGSDGGESGDDGGSGGSPVGSDAAERVDGFLTTDPATDNYDGSIVDMTGEDEVAVDVGAEGNGGGFAFGPPAVAVSAGTTVSWQWTGEGGLHNVVSTGDSDFDIDSGDPKESGDPFEQSFDDTGVCLYICEPHESLGMKGAVVVVEE